MEIGKTRNCVETRRPQGGNPQQHLDHQQHLKIDHQQHLIINNTRSSTTLEKRQFIHVLKALKQGLKVQDKDDFLALRVK